MGPYAVYVHLDLLESVPGKGEQRRQIMSFIRSLAENPHFVGDYTDRDESLRIRQIKIISRYAITYWADDPAKSVVIVGVRHADR